MNFFYIFSRVSASTRLSFNYHLHHSLSSTLFSPSHFHWSVHERPSSFRACHSKLSYEVIGFTLAIRANFFYAIFFLFSFPTGWVRRNSRVFPRIPPGTVRSETRAKILTKILETEWFTSKQKQTWAEWKSRNDKKRRPVSLRLKTEERNKKKKKRTARRGVFSWLNPRNAFELNIYLSVDRHRQEINLESKIPLEIPYVLDPRADDRDTRWNETQKKQTEQ